MSRELFEAFGRAADGYGRDAVVDACCNILANALRQSHPTRDAADEELADMAAKIRATLATNHYYADGSRRDRRLVLPPLNPLAPNLGVH